MASREVIGPDGNVGFRLQRYVWRSRPTTSPASGRPVRGVVGQDENGNFRAAKRIGRGDGKDFEIDFARESFRTKTEAIQASREITRDFLCHEAEVYSQSVKDKRPGQQIVTVEMDDGWSMAINAAGAMSAEEARLIALFARIDRQERQAGGRGPDHKPRASLQNRNRGIDR